ncbi:MAG: 16S rRNA processing protein RimM [candidate division Zixibacteria bacterium]|nr:16S rRNA processing protein RimM [candidate division Zixibacteria bacterium]
MTLSSRVALGRIGRAHGIAGAFHVWPYGQDVERFHRLQAVTLRRGDRSESANVRSVHIAGGRVLIQVDTVTTPEEVRMWLGGDLEIDAQERIPRPPGQFFHDEIVGLRVVSRDGSALGEVTSVLKCPANDVYVCRGERGEFMIPAVDVFVESIDLAAGQMVVTPIPGMVE